MPIPTRADHELAAIDDLHAVILTRLRTFRYSGSDPASVWSALREYRDRIVAFVNSNEADAK